MICTNLHDLLGVQCHPLNEEGSIAMIDTSFVFQDGDSVPVFIETFGNHIRFFDDGNTFLHFYSRGMSLDREIKLRFIKNIADANGLTFNDSSELEIWCTDADAPKAFANYIGAMVSLAAWEKDQIGLSSDTSILLDEVAQCLRAWKPSALLTPSPEFTGISGQVYKLDFDFSGEAVIAISPHHSAVSAAIKKLLDIKSAPANSNLQVLAIIDDRYDSKTAKKEGLIMDALATVWPMTKLEKQAGLTQQPH